MKRRIHLFTCILAGMLFVISGCDSSSSSSSDSLDTGEQVTVTLLQTSDVHHRVSGTGASASYSPLDGDDGSATYDLTKGGYGRLATKIFDLRSDQEAQGIPTLLVDSGDFTMGTVYDLTVASSPAAFLFMQAMQYDAITLGNHEFDYGAAGLAGIIGKAMGAGGSDFTVPIVATNMVTSDASDVDDGIEALVSSGVIQSAVVKTLSNGLKVGIIGLMGADAQIKAPLSAPITFRNSLVVTASPVDTAETMAAKAEEVAASIKLIQDKVNYLKKDQGVHIVIALSHSGVTNTDPASPLGDDILLAKKISGIDIIASGHEHVMTDAVVEVAYEPGGTDTEHTTRIICPGKYGENLSQLDITYTVGTGIDAVVLKNHIIDDSIPGDFVISTTMKILDAKLDQAIDAGLGKLGVHEINQVLVQSGSDNLLKPVKAGESGMGNLVADSLRYLLKSTVDAKKAANEPMPPTVGVVANGVVRNGFALGQQISFADMYSVLPLGMTVDPAQQSLPGYPLVTVYLTGNDIKNACQVAAYVEAAGDTAFMTTLGTLAAGDPVTYGASYYALSNLGADYYLNLSGVRYDHYGAAGGYKINPASVALYANDDYQCQGSSIAIDTYTALGVQVYPVVVDLYVLLMMQSEEFETLLGALGIPVTPLYHNGTTFAPVPKEADYKTILSLRLDSDPVTDGIQETKEWMALLKYLTSSDEGLSPRIDYNFYAKDTIHGDEDAVTGYSDVINGDGDASRVNTVALPVP